jgi:acyl carrier protein
MSHDTTTIEGVIIDALADIGVEAERISLDTPLAELDVDSLDLAELSQIISDRFGVEIGADDAGQLTTVGHLVALVGARR